MWRIIELLWPYPDQGEDPQLRECRIASDIGFVMHLVIFAVLALIVWRCGL